MQGGIDDVIARAKQLASVVMRVTGDHRPKRAVFDGEADASSLPPTTARWVFFRATRRS